MRNSLRWLIFIIFMLISNWLFPADAFAEVRLEKGVEKYTLGPLVEILEDSGNQWDIEDVASGKLDDLFYRYNGNVPSYGYTESVFWTRITVVNQTGNSDWMLEIPYPPHDWIELYEPIDSKEGFRVREAGDQMPFHTRDVHHRNFVFNVSIPSGEETVYYLKFDMDGSMQLPLRLWQEDKFRQKGQLEYLFLGVYFGFGLIMFFYNLFLYFSLRINSYLWYILFILSIMMCHFSLNGLAFQYLWPESMWWNHRAILFFMACTILTALLFSKTFLNTKFHTPRMNTFIRIIIWLQPILIAVLAINYETALNLIMVITIFSVIIIVITATLTWKKGYAPAKYFLYGWLAFFIGVMISSLADMGLVPLTFLTKYASQIGSGAEIILFSLALAEKIKQLRNQKEAAERNARISQELAVEHLKQANKVKDDFLASTSHELRTPIHGMVGIAESLRDTPGMDSRVRRNLGLIISSGMRLTHLINDLLDASKLNHHELDLEIKPINLRDLAEVVCTVSSTIHREKPVKLVNNIPEDLPNAAADENRLQQIFYNIIGNSIKYTDTGKVTLFAELSDDEITVYVEDTGIGISDKDMATIFESFKRGTTHADRGTVGTGLGLSITKKLIELQGGEISIRSTLGKGTIVSFTIPIYKGMQESESPIMGDNSESGLVAAYEATQHTVGKPTHRIMIADDEFVNTQVLLNQLSMEGYHVEVVYDGQSALEILREDTSFDLVILDVMLPRLSGFEISRQLRERYSLTELPILMLTARSQTEDIVTAFDAGANDYLTKPSSKEELLSRVKTLLSLKEMMEEVISVNKELQELNQSLESQVKRRTKELEFNTEQLHRTEQARKLLMSNISHELGTPMTSMKGFIKAMIDGVADPTDMNYLQLVYQKILFIDRLIQDLYELSRLESGRLSFRWRQMPAGEFAHSLLQKYAYDIEANGIHFEMHDELAPAARNDLVTVDTDRMNQVIQNLVINAIRFTEKSGLIRVYIRKVDKLEIAEQFNDRGMTYDSGTSFLKLSIQDSGKGMDPDTLPFIFDRFYQANKNNQENDNNSGLGLAISKQIMEYHQGCLWAESKLGIGSTFHLALPLHPQKSTEVHVLGE